MQALRDLAKDLLTKGAAAVVIGWEEGPRGARPAFNHLAPLWGVAEIAAPVRGGRRRRHSPDSGGWSSPPLAAASGTSCGSTPRPFWNCVSPVCRAVATWP